MICDRHSGTGTAFKFPPSLIVALKFTVHLLGLMEQAVQKLQYKGFVSLYPENKKEWFKQAGVSMCC